ncbi:isocitrate lyase/PEP mutase family protein [Streptomyces sp. NPDC054796]
MSAPGAEAAAGAEATGAGATGVGAFRALHHGRAQGSPLVMPGPWDGGSAKEFALAGFEALATPSHGVAASLGYEDGATPPDEMFAAVARIVRAVRTLEHPVPVTADIERGYGLPVDELVDRLLEAGAVGCNLEDSAPAEPGGAARLVEPERQADWLASFHAAADSRIFLNARIDSYLRGADDPLSDALERGRLYVAAGAESVYPFGAPARDIGVLAGELGVPVNAFCGPADSVRGLAEAGATRITFGGTLAARTFTTVRDLATSLRPVN